ncbi:unnamed protein product [Durusdinium trenchii]|uniref:Uncharacterized protein n=1 Tax=Durusdinium trenchii TaxID=1381693 RepID=A0ABP0PAB1_9DINO
MSEFQESAQFLAGPDLPKQVLSGLFNKSELPSSYVGLINLTPYDTWVEQTCLRWEANNDIKIRSLSVSKNITTIEYCQRVLAIKLLEDCARFHSMGKDVPVYQKHAPELPEVDLTKFPMQVVRVERPAHAQGWKNLKISLGQDFRMLYYDDVVFGAEWKELISDFDTRFQSHLIPETLSHSHAADAIVEEDPGLPAWDEPTNVQDLTDRPDSSTQGAKVSDPGKAVRVGQSMPEGKARLPMTSAERTDANDPRLTPQRVAELSQMVEESKRAKDVARKLKLSPEGGKPSEESKKAEAEGRSKTEVTKGKEGRSGQAEGKTGNEKEEKPPPKIGVKRLFPERSTKNNKIKKEAEDEEEEEDSLDSDEEEPSKKRKNTRKAKEEKKKEKRSHEGGETHCQRAGKGSKKKGEGIGEGKQEEGEGIGEGKQEEAEKGKKKQEKAEMKNENKKDKESAKKAKKTGKAKTAEEEPGKETAEAKKERRRAAIAKLKAFSKRSKPSSSKAKEDKEQEEIPNTQPSQEDEDAVLDPESPDSSPANSEDTLWLDPSPKTRRKVEKQQLKSKKPKEPNPGLRAVYQQHLKEAMARIKEEHPDWKPLEVLTEARAQFAVSSIRVRGTKSCVELQRVFEPVDGGDDRACRGDSATDNSAEYYQVKPNVKPPADVKAKTGSCDGLEFKGVRCEIWTRPIRASKRLSGYTCLRYVDPESLRHGSFEPVDGATGRACRGRHANDNSPADCRPPGLSLEGCQRMCQSEAECVGVEHHEGGRCELWTRAGGIQASAAKPGYSCWRFLEEGVAPPTLRPGRFEPVDSGTGRVCRGAGGSAGGGGTGRC